MPRFVITYLDSKTGEHVYEWDGEAVDSFDAIGQAQEDDYYMGKIVDIEEMEDE